MTGPARAISNWAGYLRPGAFDVSNESGRARERLRRAAMTTAASVSAKLIALATNLIAIPLTLNYLGAERFGLWATISSVNALLEFADLGLGNGLLNTIATASATEDREKIQRAVSSAFFLLTAIALVIAGSFYLFNAWLPWRQIFSGASDALISDARASSAVFVGCFAVGLPLGIVRRVQLGFQEGAASNLWQCLASLLALGSLLAAMHLHAGLPVLVLCLTGAPVTAMALNWIVEFGFNRRWLIPSARHFHWSTGSELTRAGLMFVTLQVAALLLYTADPLIAARYRGLAAVADFSVAQKLFMLAATLQAMWLMPLWPAYGEAAARGDGSWVRRTLLWTTLAACSAAALIGFVLVVFRAPVFALWLHRDWAPSLSLSIALAASAVALATGNAVSMFLNGVNAIREQAGAAAVMTVAVLALKIVLCKHYGVTGIPWGMFIGYTGIMTPFLWALIRQRLRSTITPSQNTVGVGQL